MYTPKHLKKWIDTGSYMGDDLSEYYVLIAHTRDSELLEESNWDCIKAELEKRFTFADSIEGIKANSELLLGYFSHWACGWIESIMIHESNEKALMIGDDIKAELLNYPVYNDDDYSEKQFNSWYANCETAVKDYLNDNSIEGMDDKIGEIIRAGDWEINEDLWPEPKQIETAYNEVLHTKHCDTCGADYKDYSACDCQTRLL